jgi:hypothetical protein
MAEEDGGAFGWMYARADPEQSYVVPLVPPEDSTGAFEALLAEVREWFLNREVSRFVLDVPNARSDLRAALARRGRVLWHRAVLDRGLSPLPSNPAVSSEVREFRRSDLAAAQTLFGIRHPESPPPPIPVPFLELRGSWFKDPAWELRRTIWIAGPRRQLLGVAGGTHRPRASAGFLGPWVLSETASPLVATELLGAVLDWLQADGAHRVRTTVPTPFGDDARTLIDCGFVTMAESDLYEVKS